MKLSLIFPNLFLMCSECIQGNTMKPKPPPASSNHIKGDNRGRGGMAMKGGEGGGGEGQAGIGICNTGRDDCVSQVRQVFLMCC